MKLDPFVELFLARLERIGALNLRLWEQMNDNGKHLLAHCYNSTYDDLVALGYGEDAEAITDKFADAFLKAGY